MRGFIVLDPLRHDGAISMRDMSQVDAEEGKMTWRETVVDGIEHSARCAAQRSSRD